ncbi:MAG: F0F1 ATP synthase subunit B [Planctomycetota bacterium]|jgi:F-type H+-transporting ATPase subunit b
MDLLFNENTISALFWTVFWFGAVTAILAVFAWPRILKALLEREKRIEAAVQSAEEKNAEAEAVIVRYEARLEEARTEAQKIIEEGKAEAEAIKAKFLKEQYAETEAMKKAALEEIDLARDAAVSDLQTGAGDLSVSIASGLIGKKVKPGKDG